MAGIFPAMGNPAAGANAASGLGNQFLGFLANLPQQLEQWQQLKQQRQDSAFKNFQVLSQLATTVPGITDNPRFAQTLGATAKQLGVDPKTFLGPDGKVNASVFSNAAMRTLLQDPQNYKQYVESTPEDKGKLWGIWGGVGPAPAAFVNGPYRPNLPAGTINRMYGLPQQVAGYAVDPLSAIEEVKSTADSLRANGYDPEGIIAGIQQAASSPLFDVNRAIKVGKSNLQAAQYQKAVQDAATSALHGDLYKAQTAEANYQTNVVLPTNVAHTNAETTQLIPSEVDANYGKAAQANAQAQRTILATRDQVMADAKAMSIGLVPGIPPDKLQGFRQTALTNVGKAEAAKNAAATNFANAVKSLGLDTSAPEGNASPQQLEAWLNSQSAIAQAALRPLLQSVQQANQTLYIANKVNEHVNHFNTNVPPGAPGTQQQSSNGAPQLPQHYAQSGYTAVQHQGKWYMTNDGGKNLYPIPSN